MTTLRILTWNIHGGKGVDGRRSIKRIAEVILQVHPHIVCLQEVHQRTLWGGMQNQPGMLQQLLAMDARFLRCLNYGIGGEGIWIGSILPVLQSGSIFLPSVRERRGLLWIEVQVRHAVRARVFCTHWGLKRDERARQAELVCQQLHSSSLPALFCGDLNDAPGQPCIDMLLESAGMQDAGAKRQCSTFPSAAPSHRIDYCMATQHWRLADEVTMGGCTASDHLPLWAEWVLAE